jgi:hypothetical protein
VAADDPVYPWARLPRETPKAYATFLLYRDMPPKHMDPHQQRSLNNLARNLDVTVPAIQGWCSLHSWVQRAAAWDVAQAKERDRAHFAAISEMSRRQAHDSQRTQAALGVVTEALVRKVNADYEGTLKELGSMQAAKLIELLADVQHSLVKVAGLERLARGAETARVSLQESDSLGLYDQMLADEDVADLAEALVRKLTEPAPAS